MHLTQRPTFCSECGEQAFVSHYGPGGGAVSRDEVERVEIVFHCGVDHRGSHCANAKPAQWSKEGLLVLDSCSVCGEKLTFTSDRAPYRLIARCPNEHDEMYLPVPAILAPTPVG